VDQPPSAPVNQSYPLADQLQNPLVEIEVFD